MAPNPRRIHARLDGLYARLPHLDCQGVCTDSCGPIPAGQHERARIERARGRPLDAPEHVSRVGQVMEACHECSMLENGRCSVYEIRPMICRPGWASYAKQEIRRLAADPRARRLMLNHHRPTLAGRRASTKPTVIERGYRG
jgi:Fe-S-cluster containining protein